MGSPNNSFVYFYNMFLIVATIKNSAYEAHLASYTLYNRFLRNMLCCHNTLFTKNELNREYIITLARNDENP